MVFFFLLLRLWPVLLDHGRKVRDRLLDLAGQHLFVEIPKPDRKLFIVALQNVMDPLLELLASGLENQELITVPPCQLLVLLHLQYPFRGRLSELLLDLRTQVEVKADDSVDSRLDSIHIIVVLELREMGVKVVAQVLQKSHPQGVAA